MIIWFSTFYEASKYLTKRNRLRYFFYFQPTFPLCEYPWNNQQWAIIVRTIVYISFFVTFILLTPVY